MAFTRILESDRVKADRVNQLGDEIIEHENLTKAPKNDAEFTGVLKLNSVDIGSAIGQTASDLNAHKAERTAHGVSGNIVGTSDTQTLSNKTFAGETIMTGATAIIKKNNNTDRLGIAGGTALTGSAGSYIVLEGADYGGIGSGGSILLSVPASGRLNIGRAGLMAGIIIGTGSPEGGMTAPVGFLYLSTNGSAGTTLYVKESGAGNTGWKAK